MFSLYNFYEITLVTLCFSSKLPYSLFYYDMHTKYALLEFFYISVLSLFIACNLIFFNINSTKKIPQLKLIKIFQLLNMKSYFLFKYSCDYFIHFMYRYCEIKPFSYVKNKKFKQSRVMYRIIYKSC